ncbi:MAG: TetR/AcrR family transcriptional regulator [Streptosporangiaceae bacterium]
MSSPVETRLLDGAARLFYERGIAASGVDAISAVSGVSKPTLYGHFGTKSALVAMVLERQHQQRRASLEEHLAARSALAPAGRLLSVFDWIAAHQRGDWRRGCPFVNASVELVRPADGTAREAVRRHKRWFRGVLAGLAEEAEVADPVAMASQLHLLIEGANARMLAEGDAAAIGDARRAAGVLLAAASHRGGAYGHAQPGEVTGAHVPGSRRTRRGS